MMRIGGSFLMNTEHKRDTERDMDHNLNSLAISSNLWDKKALAFEIAVEQKRHHRHRSALFVMQTGRDKFEATDSDLETDDAASEYDLTMNFSGLNWRQKIKKLCAVVFIVLAVPSSSGLARTVSLLINSIIVLAVLSYILSTEMTLRTIPATCSYPVCDNDSNLCPGAMICRDEISSQFNLIDDLCTYLFTMEYGLRLLTCWAVTPRVAGILPAEWEAAHRYDRDDAAQPQYSPLWTAVKYALQYKNLLDLASIVPSYVAMAISSNGQDKFVRVLQLLRVVRILRLLRLLSFMKNVDVAKGLITETLRQSAFILSVFLFFVMIIITLFGCLIYLCEGGTYTITDDYPNGAYLRLSNTGRDLEPTPFDSIPTGMYWVIGTATGAGDLAATSVAGRAVACVLEVIGVLGLAIPVGVIGSELDRAYTKHFVRLMKISDNKEAQLVQDAMSSADLVLKKKPARDGTATPPVEDVANLRDAHGKIVDGKAAEMYAAVTKFKAAKSRKSSTLCAPPLSLDDHIESYNISTPHLRPDAQSFTAERRKSTGGKRSRESSSKSRPLDRDRLSGGEAWESSGPLDGIKALVAAAKENVHRAVRQLRSLEGLEREIIASEGAYRSPPPGLSGLPVSTDGRRTPDRGDARSHSSPKTQRCQSSTSILAAIERRFSLKAPLRESSYNSSSTDEGDVFGSY